MLDIADVNGFRASGAHLPASITDFAGGAPNAGGNRSPFGGSRS